MPFWLFYFGWVVYLFFVFFILKMILLWSCICRGLTLNLSQARICDISLLVQAFMKWYCLPSVVGLSYVHYFSKVFPETEGMCRAVYGVMPPYRDGGCQNVFFITF